MSLQTRAIIFADEGAFGFIQFLREFLFKVGFRQTIVTTNPNDVSNLINSNCWPVVFLDHTEGTNDALQLFEGIYKVLGHQLIPYVFTAPADNHLFDSVYISIGAVGLIKKPIQVSSAEKMMRAVISQPHDPTVKLAHQISKALLQGNLSTVDASLNKLSELPQYKRHAQVTLLRIEMAQGLMSKANERFRHLLRDYPRDLRILSEYANFLKKNSLYSNALKCYQRMRSLHPQLLFKCWEQVALHLELEQLDEAAQLLETMKNDATHKELAAEALARMMYFMGLQHNIPNFIKPHTNTTRNYNAFTATTTQKKVSPP